MSRGRSLLAASAVVLAIASGCLTAPATDGATDSGSTAMPTATPTSGATPTAPMSSVATTDSTPSAATAGPTSLDDRLRELYRTENRTAYAETRGLRYADGRVDAVAELRNGAELPEGYDVRVTADGGGMVQARIAVDDLPALASEAEVRYVRPPRGAAADGPTEASGR